MSVFDGIVDFINIESWKINVKFDVSDHRAVLALRKAKKVSKLIYISCDPKAATKNLIDFARPSSKQYHGEPFVPVTAIPIDMFPHTRHCELVLCLERLSNLESKTS